MSFSDLRVLVIGAGSIGSRHFRNLTALGASTAIADLDASRAVDVGGDAGVDLRPGRLVGYDAVVVASPTVSHRDHAEAALEAGAVVMVEKPLHTTAEGLDRLVTKGRDRLMVGYNLRLHEPVERLVAHVASGRVGRPLAGRLWFGSYLPDWRPTTDYRGTYSARADLGGGILLDAIHELDLTIWLFGDDLEVAGAVLGRFGSLDVDVEDTVRALLRASDGTVVEVALDYLSRRYRRGIEVVGEEATVRLDWARSVIEVEDAAGVVTEDASTPVDRSYEREAEVFLRFVRGQARPPVGAELGAASVRLADRIRDAAR